MDNKVGRVSIALAHCMHCTQELQIMLYSKTFTLDSFAYRYSNMVFARGATVLTSLANIKVLDLN